MRYLFLVAFGLAAFAAAAVVAVAVAMVVGTFMVVRALLGARS